MTARTMLLSDEEIRKAKRYEIGVHCSQLCLGGRASLTETTDPDPFSEDVVMATDYDALLARYDEAISLMRQAAPAIDLISLTLSKRFNRFLAAHFKEDKT